MAQHNVLPGIVTITTIEALWLSKTLLKTKTKPNITEDNDSNFAANHINT